MSSRRAFATAAKKAGRNVAVFVGFLLVWIVPLEVAARAWIERFGDPLDHAIRVLQMEPHLGWRQKAHFHGRFLGVPLKTNERGLRNPALSTAMQADRRVLVLGPSSTFGWGVPEEATYARQLERLLRDAMPDRSLAVINAGEIGFSSWQGLEFYRRELRRLHPDLLVVAYGANDVDRHRFFLDSPLPDRVALGRGQPVWAIALQNTTGHLLVFPLARRKLATWLGRFSCPLRYDPETASHGVPSLRVSLQDSVDNLRAFARLAREDGSAIVLMTTGFWLPRAAEVSADQAGQSRALLEAGKRSVESQQFGQAIEVLSQSLSANPHQCEAHYVLSVAYAGLRDCHAAQEAFQAAREAEPARVEQDLRMYNQFVRALASQEGVPLVDPEALFADGEPARWFLDPIHLTEEGHARIAQALFNTIVEDGLLN